MIFLFAGDLLALRDRHVLVALHLSRQQRVGARTGVGRHPEGHRVETGDLVAAEAADVVEPRIGLVAVIAAQLHVAVGDEFFHLIRAGADRRNCWGRAFSYCFGMIVIGTVNTDTASRNVGVGCFSDDDERVRIGRLEMIDAGEHRTVHADALEAAERGHHVGGGHLLAVVEGDALAELEGERAVIGAGALGAGELQHRLHVLVARHQRLEHVHRDVAGGGGGGGVLIKPGDVGLQRVGEVPAAVAAGEMRRLRCGGRRNRGTRQNCCPQPGF